MKPARLLRVLTGPPLNYRIVRISGSHKFLRSNSYPNLVFAFHHSQEISSTLVKIILVEKIGLSEEEALEVLK
jgi:predicted RNA binding protein YcfA (HicA-like mRNA interferase family)